MRALVVCSSISAYRNTDRVARAIASVLAAEVAAPGETTSSDVAGYDLLALGSGIYSFAYHRDLRRLVASLRLVEGASAFVFSTSGGPAWMFWPATWLLIRQLTGRGYRVLGQFSCHGAYDWPLPLLLPSGNVGHPDESDLDRARRRALGWCRVAGAAGVRRMRS